MGTDGEPQLQSSAGRQSHTPIFPGLRLPNKEAGVSCLERFNFFGLGTEVD